MNNLLSLLLGLLSWGLGIAAIWRTGSRWLSMASLLTCGLSLLLQLAEVHRLVRKADWSALLDTMDAVLLAAGVLLTVTCALNLMAYLKK